MLTAIELDHAATPAQLPDVGAEPTLELDLVVVVEVVDFVGVVDGELEGGGAEALPVRAFLAEMS